MTGLFPDALRDAIESKSLYGASESFGVVTLVLLVIVLLEQEALRAAGASPARQAVLSAVAVPLLLAVLLTIGFRIGELL